DDLRNKDIAKYNALREDYYELIRQAEDRLRQQRGLKVPEEAIVRLEKCLEKIVRAFNQEKVIFLANNSIKQYLRIVGQYYRYCVREEANWKDSQFIGHERTTKQIITAFLSWIHTVDEPFGIPTFN